MKLGGSSACACWVNVRGRLLGLILILGLAMPSAKLLFGQDNAVLTLDDRFSLNDCLQSQAFASPRGEKLVAKNGFIAGAIAPDPTGQRAALVGIDVSGRAACWAVPLGEEEFFDVALSDNAVAVLTAAVTGRGASRIRIFNRSGALLEENTAHPDLFRLVYIKNGLFGVTRRGVIRDILTGTERATALDQSAAESSIYLSVSGGTVRMIDQRTGSLATVGSGPARRSSLEHPYLTAARAFYATDGHSSAVRPRLIISAAVDSADTGYVLASGFTATEGAPVMIMPAGRDDLTRAVRLPLSASEKSAFQIPVSLAADGGRLYLLDSTSTVTVFRLQ